MIRKFHCTCNSLQINNTNIDLEGYDFLFLSGDVWAQLKMNITFSRWYGKNIDSLTDLMSKWAVPEKHVIRSASYKGGYEVTSLPGFRYDAVSSLGLLSIIGSLAQIRGLAGSSQMHMVGFLRDILGKCLWSNGLSILPDVVLHVENGETSLRELWPSLTRQAKSTIKARPKSKDQMQLVVLFSQLVVA